MQRLGHIDKAPHIPSPKLPGPRERCLTRQEAARLLRAARTDHLRIFIRLGLYTWARSGAILDLEWARRVLENRLSDYGGGE